MAFRAGKRRPYSTNQRIQFVMTARRPAPNLSGVFRAFGIGLGRGTGRVRMRRSALSFEFL